VAKLTSQTVAEGENLQLRQSAGLDDGVRRQFHGEHIHDDFMTPFLPASPQAFIPAESPYYISALMNLHFELSFLLGIDLIVFKPQYRYVEVAKDGHINFGKILWFLVSSRNHRFCPPSRLFPQSTPMLQRKFKSWSYQTRWLRSFSF
jgi:hypothetical protein